ncbi:MAG: PfkB family carbohydrate kinase [candidate division FCPU426 bacterium]
MELKSELRHLAGGVCAPLPCALDASGAFDAAAQERLVAWVLQAGAGVHAIYSSPSPAGLSGVLRRQADEASHFSAGSASHWVGVGATSLEELLENIERALGLGAAAVVFDPLALPKFPDPALLFQRQISPFFEKLGRGLPVLLESGGVGRRLKTNELKHLARLEGVRGVIVSDGPKVAGDYLKGARHHKARHEFGVFLSDARSIFQTFKPGLGAVGALRERLQRLWIGAESPSGVVPLSANLFPVAWRQAWAAAQAGDAERLDAFGRLLGSLEFPADPMACVKAALLSEGVLSSDRALPGSKSLDPAARKLWLAQYTSLKNNLAETQKRLGLETMASKAKPDPKPKATTVEAVDAAQSWDIAGMGGVAVDEFCRVNNILGPESKGPVLGAPVRAAGGVTLNQVSWARAFGASAALFGFSGDDSNADFLRAALARRGVDASWLRRKKGPTMATRIYVDAQGGRAIYAEPGVILDLRPADVSGLLPAIKAAAIVVTEVSQLRLDVVLAILQATKRSGKLSALDLDIPASQATAKGGLGSKKQLEKALQTADFLKTSAESARELFPKAKGNLAAFMHKALKKKAGFWVAVSAGAAGCQLSDGVQDCMIPACKGVKVLDTTGAGDAFMAGLLVGTRLKLSLKDLGRFANAAGACAVAHLGAGPPEKSVRSELLAHYKGPLALGPEPKKIVESFKGGQAFMRSAATEMERLAARYDAKTFDAAKALIQEAEKQGRRVHVTGVGKPEYVAGYAASSFSSTGTPAFFLHATEAGHGASGQVSPGDLVIAISNSGETAELKSAVATVKKNGAKVIGVSGKSGSWLARQSDVFLFAGVDQEGDTLNLAPRASVLAEIMVLAALGVELQEAKRFSAKDFRSYHPGGSLGGS